MGADAVDQDVDAVRGGSDEAGLDDDSSRRQLRGDMEGKRVIGSREACVEAVLDHQPGTADPLLGRLGDQHHRAAPALPEPNQLPRRADQRGDVNVVAAGVHHRRLDIVDAGLPNGRCIRKAAVLAERQPVHVGADQHGRPVAVPEQPDDAGAADPFGDLGAGRAQLAGDDPGGPGLAVAQFRIAVEIEKQRLEMAAIILRHRRREIGLRRRRRRAPRHRAGEQYRLPHRAAPQPAVQSPIRRELTRLAVSTVIPFAVTRLSDSIS